MQTVDRILGAPSVIEKGGELYRNGRIGILISGTAKIKRRGGTGITVTVRSLGEGEIFGAASVFGEWKIGSSSISADTRCSVCYISEDALKQLFSEIPQIALNYIAFLTDRIRFLNRRIDAFSAGSTEHKLYEYLMSQADCNGIVRLDFGMAELSRRLKIGRSSLYRGVDALISAGYIERSKNTFKVNKV